MEKGIDSYLKEQFEIPDVDIRTYSPLTLAYIGDGIYDLVLFLPTRISSDFSIASYIFSNNIQII